MVAREKYRLHNIKLYAKRNKQLIVKKIGLIFFFICCFKVVQNRTVMIGCEHIKDGVTMEEVLNICIDLIFRPSQWNRMWKRVLVRGVKD